MNNSTKNTTIKATLGSQRDRLNFKLYINVLVDNISLNVDANYNVASNTVHCTFDSDEHEAELEKHGIDMYQVCEDIESRTIEIN